MFSGDRTGGEEQFTGDRDFVAGNLPASLPVKVEYPLGVIVEFLTRRAEQNSTTLALEQGGTERFFEDVDPLTDSRLGQVECLRRPGKTVQLRGLREGFQIRKLYILRLFGVHHRLPL